MSRFAGQVAEPKIPYAIEVQLRALLANSIHQEDSRDIG